MNGGALFSFRMVPIVASMLATRRIDVQSLLDAAQLPGDAMRGEIIAPLDRVQQFLALAGERLGTATFGIELAERVPPGAFGLVEFAMRSASTVERAMRVLCELAPLINPLLDVTFTGQELHFAVPSRRDALGMHLNEYTLVLVVRQFSTVLGERLALERAWFAHARRTHVDDVRRVFGCNVEFGAADCGLALSRASLDRVPPTADPVLFEFLSAQARVQLANLGPRDIISQVARVIDARLPAGSVDGAAVAAAMATTLRSLQRHLAGAGTSYREVLRHVRLRRRAELARSGLEPTEIARRLGFSTVGAMRRSLDETE